METIAHVVYGVPTYDPLRNPSFDFSVWHVPFDSS